MSETQFEYLVRASGGWTQARLTLSDNTALIEYDATLMGTGQLRYRLHCLHNIRSDFHGELTLTSIEQFVRHQNQFGTFVIGDAVETVDIGRLIDPDADDDLREVMNRLDMEYIRLPEAQTCLEEPGGGWGIHAWTETFSLILMIHFAGFWVDESGSFEKTPLGQGLVHLDKMHFALAQGRYSA